MKKILYDLKMEKIGGTFFSIFHFEVDQNRGVLHIFGGVWSDLRISEAFFGFRLGSEA